MKTTFLTIAVLLITISLTAQQQQTQKPISVQNTLIKLASPADTLQYTLGAFIGQWITKNGFTISNPVLFKRGMDDVFQNKPLAVTDSTIVQRIGAYQQSMASERNKLLEQQLFTNMRGKPGVGALPDGVLYVVIKAGTGVRSSPKDSVVINAIGVFPDGTIFEDTFKKKQSITTLTSSLIPGLNEAIQLMPEGSVWRIFIPAAQGYGPAGFSNIIPPNMALVFEITLMEVKQGKK